MTGFQTAQRPFEGEQLAFYGQAAGEPAERGIVGDNSVTRDDDRQRIGAHRIADRPGVVPASNPCGNPLV